MTEQRKRLERALRGCAERGVPGTSDPWPTVRERLTGERMSEERTSAAQTGEERVATGSQRRSRVPHLVPNTPLGWALAIVSVLLIGTGVYSVSGSVNKIFDGGLPSGVGPGSEKVDRERGALKDKKGRAPQETQGVRTAQSGGAPDDLLRYSLPGIEGSGLVEELGEVQTADGARVTLERVYADETAVVVAYSVRDLSSNGEKGVGLMNEGLQPVSVMDSERTAPSAPRYSVDLTDTEGGDFGVINGGGMTDSGYVEWYEEIFEAPDGLQTSREHHFRLEIPVSKGFPPEGDLEPDAGPFVFDFAVPVHPAPVVEVDQKDTAKGATLTLERVVNSPGRPQAIVCFVPPDEKHTWMPLVDSTGFPPGADSGAVLPSKGNCWSAMLGDPVSGHSSVTVAELTGMLRDISSAREAREPPKTIRGPWTFEFEAPGR